MPHIPDHLTHDPELVAAYAAGDATGPDLAAATELVAACTECADLHRDLRAIATALPELPVPARTRDFRLTHEQAASLRPSGWRGVLAAFASPRFRLAAPLGTGLAAAGLAGLLLATPGGLGGASSGGTASGAAPAVPTTAEGRAKDQAAADESDGAFLAPAASPAAGSEAPEAMASAAASEAAAIGPVDLQTSGNPEIQAAGPAVGASPDGGGAAAGTQPASSPDRELVARATSSSPSAPVATDTSAGAERPAAASTGSTPWLIVSAVLVLVGVALLVLRLAARSLSHP